jgi:hypothetical protein
MSNPEAYTREIKSINFEIKRSNTRLDTLRSQRKQKQDFLYKYMIDHNMEKYEGVTINSIRPKELNKRKPEIEKKKDAIELFTQEGIIDPEDFYTKLKNTQKFRTKNTDDNTNDEDYSIKRNKKRKNENYDPFLGF